MTPPASFVDSLKIQLPHLRIRWSERTSQWHIEQKVGRQKLPSKRFRPDDDRAIRLMDGTEFVLAITPGDRAGCPQCSATVYVPVMQWREATCPQCGKAFRAMHWPLSDALLEHLRWSDPYRGGTERAMKLVEQSEAYRDYSRLRARNNYLEAATKDLFNPIHGIPTFGYRG